MDFAIVDIETTGGKPAQHYITEIAIVISDGQRIKERFSTLVHTRQEIPIFIQRLTGISNEMLQDAPPLEEIAPRIMQMLHNKVFVAHNVNFDFKFLTHHLAQCGYQLSLKRICTVRLSRKIIPGLPSYSLGRLCKSLGIRVNNRHRALGDAEATARLLHLLLEKDSEKLISKHIRSHQREFSLPPNLERSEYEALPAEAGVYYMLDEKSRPLYIGKAANIRKRIASHFASSFDEKNFLALYSRIHHISYTITGNELTASLLESYEIKKQQPPFNRAQRRGLRVYNLLSYTDRAGWIRLAIEKGFRQREAIATYTTLPEARNHLYELAAQFRLCEKKLFLSSNSGPCNGRKTGQCDGACTGDESAESHNEKMKQALAQLREEEPSRIIIGKGRDPEEKAIVCCKNGQYLGFGFLPHDVHLHSFEEALDYIRNYPADSDVQHIIRAFISGPKKGFRIVEMLPGQALML